jgi:hypothetical protein
MAEEHERLWFGKRPNWLGFGPLTWQGRAATGLYVLLLVVAVITYSRLALTALVVVFYTVVYVMIVLVKSDLKDRLGPPGS